MEAAVWLIVNVNTGVCDVNVGKQETLISIPGNLGSQARRGSSITAPFQIDKFLVYMNFNRLLCEMNLLDVQVVAEFLTVVNAPTFEAHLFQRTKIALFCTTSSITRFISQRRNQLPICILKKFTNASFQKLTIAHEHFMHFFHFSRWTERHCSSAGSRWCAFLIFAFLARSWTAALFCLFWPHSSHFHIFAVFAPPSLSLLGSSSIVPFVPHQTGHRRNKCTPTTVGHEMKSESGEMSLRLQNWESWWRVPGTHHRMTVRQRERQRRRDPRFCETPCPPVTNHQRSSNSITHQHT